MKKLIFTTAVFLTILSTFSCTKIIYNANDHMARYKTKQDIVKDFGLPAEKRSGEGIEEWLYTYGTVTTRTHLGNSTDNNASATSINVTQFNQYDSYVKFTLDGNGNVLKWESRGVDLAIRAKAPVRTVLYGLFWIGAIIVFAIAASRV
jgi:hypothetical protein